MLYLRHRGGLYHWKVSQPASLGLWTLKTYHNKIITCTQIQKKIKLFLHKLPSHSDMGTIIIWKQLGSSSFRRTSHIETKQVSTLSLNLQVFQKWRAVWSEDDNILPITLNNWFISSGTVRLKMDTFEISWLGRDRKNVKPVVTQGDNRPHITHLLWPQSCSNFSLHVKNCPSTDASAIGAWESAKRDS